MKILITCLLLASCVQAQQRPWAQASWSRVGYDEADARCRAEIQRNMDLSWIVCMGSMGWRER